MIKATHNEYHKSLKSIWDKATALYSEGNRDASSYFNPDESQFLDSIGATAQEVFDFAEDYNLHGEPDFTSFALVQDIRRSYFLEEQGGVRASDVVDPATLPSKQEEAEGIVWLPRIIQKAKAKLQGRMHPNMMYGCGGDRHFLKENDIHIAEFLRIVWRFENDEAAIVQWTLKRVGKA